jgi:4-alpha-glucanotransferase
VERFATANRDRVRFHMWLQWLIDQQLAKATGALPILGDLAIGVDPDGADAWAWQDVFARGVRVGAPPDEFNPAGQDWGLPPFVPWRLRALGYEPLAATLRAAVRHCGALRIDHAMGLFRLFWIPEGGTPTDGAYVRYPGTELLDVLAIESVRAGATIVGEDLGTVEPQVRQHLHERSVLSYKLVWFEAQPPAAYPAQSLAAVTTHDLPTIAGVWTGADAPDPMCDRLIAVSGAAPGAPVDDVVVATYDALASAPSMVTTATLEDALGVVDRPNHPGDIGRPNWSLALPVPIEDVVEHKTARKVAAALARRTSHQG